MTSSETLTLERNYKSNMQTVCPNCRHTYQNDIHSICPPCYEEKMPVVLSSTIHLPSNCSSGMSTNCKVNINATYDISLSNKNKQQRLRHLLTSGSIIRDNSENDKTSSDKSTCKSKSSKDVHSPTASLSFLLPPSIFASCRAFSILEENSFYNSEDDLKRIAMSQKYLKTSGFYHQQLTWKEARKLLMPTPVGTFLVRDSSDCKYLYSLSVQTKCGPTSIRIHYSKGEFRLDADQSMVQYMPKFPCIIKLIQFYIDSTKKLPLKCLYDENQIWIDCLGLIYSQIVVNKPLYAKNYFPSLKHLSRLCINKHLLDPNLTTVVPAPSFVVNYLQEYPYKY
ncbi:suppressor of cytokine signaling 3-like isoform X2 [Planococcus citri]|uniref:suppressor of cytokine signaling 3-like isoform X2 n=1 Tax=Planococcus citri TaxID=170843 RepID=UPI0031F8143D